MGSKAEKPSEIYERLCLILPKPLALYIVCAAQNVAYASAEVGSWEEYEAHGTFADGETDIQSVLFSSQNQRERWDSMWGADRDESDCKRLDEYRRINLAQLDSLGGIVDPQQEDTARQCAIMALEREKNLKLISSPDMKADEKAKLSGVIKTLDETIRKNLADANMRKADILPSAQQRPDGIVDALKKKYGLSMEMTKDEFLEAFYRWCRQRKHPQTVDAEEHALLGILRTIQKNDDMPEPTDLPEELRLGAFSSEFAEEPNDAENDVYRYLHLVRDQFGQPQDDGDGGED